MNVRPTLFTAFLCGLLLALPASASLGANRWPAELKAGPFVVHADFSLKGFEPLMREMGRLQYDVSRTLELPISKEPIHLFLFSHKNSYQGYLGQYFPGVPFRRALFIKGRGPGMVFAYYNDEFAVDVRHESTHAVLHSALPKVPLWLDEGIAEYFEVDSASRASKNPHMVPLMWSLRLGSFRRIETLEEIVRLDKMGRDEYRHAWGWVHFLLHESPETRRVLIAYLADVHEGRPTDTLSRRLRRVIPDLDQRYLAHFRNWQS